MQALREITQWDTPTPNHTYLLEGSTLIAYIKQGESEPFYFSKPIKNFDQRYRKFESVTPNPFSTPAPTPVEAESNVKLVQGSKGQTYRVDLDQMTCTCSGFTFRGSCKHVKELETA
jgi:hypothetical protein